MWSKIKAEYVSGGTSYRKLAEKYGVSFNTLKDVAVREKWTELRQQAHNNAATKMVDAVSSENAKINKKYYGLVDKLLNKAEKVIDNTKIWQISNLKEMATVMKYLKECKGVKPDIDIMEQQARIKKLHKEIEADNVDESKPSGVVLMPPIIDDLKPPKGEDDG